MNSWSSLRVSTLQVNEQVHTGPGLNSFSPLGCDYSYFVGLLCSTEPTPCKHTHCKVNEPWSIDWMSLTVYTYENLCVINCIEILVRYVYYVYKIYVYFVFYFITVLYCWVVLQIAAEQLY